MRHFCCVQKTTDLNWRLFLHAWNITETKQMEIRKLIYNFFYHFTSHHIIQRFHRLVDCIEFFGVRNATGATEIHGDFARNRVIRISHFNHNWFE